MQTTIQIVLEPKQKKEIKALAKAEGRSLSNMAGWLLFLGRMKYDESKAAAQPKESVSA